MKKFIQHALTATVLLTGIATNTFAQWQTVGTAGFSAGEVSYTSLAFSNSGEPYVAYRDHGNSGKATVMKFDGIDWVTVGTAGFSTGRAYYTSLAFSSSGEPYLAYQDYVSFGRAFVKKFDGTSWVTVGTGGLSAGAASYTSLAFSNSGEPYVAYRDEENSDKATVMKFDGTNWVNVGTAGFSTGRVQYVSLAFSSSNELYVAYKDIDVEKPTVMKFDGTNWVTVGTTGLSGWDASHISLALSSSGEPYVAYVTYGGLLYYQATVKRFDGTSWVNVGTGWVSDVGADYTSLAFSNSGEPYLAYSSTNAIVKKFDGTSWITVGTPGFFSAGRASYTSLALSNSGEPYVAYMDAANSGKLTVMKFTATTGIDDMTWETGISVYPNPANSILNLQTDEIIETVNIYNTVGALVQTENQHTFSVAQLPAGIYLVRIETLKGTGTVRLVKE